MRESKYDNDEKIAAKFFHPLIVQLIEKWDEIC